MIKNSPGISLGWSCVEPGVRGGRDRVKPPPGPGSLRPHGPGEHAGPRARSDPRGFSAPEEAAPALPAHPIPIITINSPNWGEKKVP